MKDFTISPDESTVTLDNKKYLFVNTGDKTAEACGVCDLQKYCNSQFPCLTEDDIVRKDGHSGIFKLSAV